jgi:hypothetical protein
MNARPLCTLHIALGRADECPGAACAFWDEGGAVVTPACLFERTSVEIESRPSVARWLLGIRNALEQARTAEETKEIRSALNAVLPPGLHD